MVPVVLGWGCGEGLSVAGGGAAPGFALLNPSFSPAHSEEMRFLFVLSSVAKNEKILTAELHLFRLWPRVTDGPKRHHFCQVRRGMGMDGAVPQPVPRDATGTLWSLACSGTNAWLWDHIKKCFTENHNDLTVAGS